MTIEEFRARVKSKMGEDAREEANPTPVVSSSNGAFANLNKEVNKKFKK